MSFLDISNASFLLQLREWALHGLDVVFVELLLDDRIVVPVDEVVIRCLVLDDAHLGIDIVLELEVVAVEVIGRDVEQNGNVGTEVVHVVELERTQFDDIVLVRFLSHLESKTLTDISGQSHVVSGTLEDVIDQRGGCRLAVAARDTDHLGVRISSCELNLADDMRVLSHQFLHHRSLFWDARAFDDLVGTVSCTCP